LPEDELDHAPLEVESEAEFLEEILGVDRFDSLLQETSNQSGQLFIGFVLQVFFSRIRYGPL